VVTIVVAGPQATGKTSLAVALGSTLAVPVFSRDPLIAVQLAAYPRLVRQCLRGRAARAGLRIQTSLLARQLELGRSSVLECVAPPAARAEWRRLALAAGGRYFAVECVCSATSVHRARVAARRDASGGRGASWRQVETATRRYEPDPDADFIADSVLPVAELAERIASMAGPGR
jgi:predicted kinase